MLKDIGNGYEIEKDTYCNKASIYLWKNKHEIVAAWLEVPEVLADKYEKILIDECAHEGGKEYRLYYKDYIEREAIKILESKNKKIRKYKINDLIKQLKEKKI